jgi:antitoxin CcdA
MSRAQARRATNVSLPVELVDEARKLDVNLSREFEAHLTSVISKRRAERWREENRKAIDAYNKYVERCGIWNEDERGW